MKIKYNRFALIPHCCSKCEEVFWLEKYKHYKVERISAMGCITFVTNICKKCADEVSAKEGADNDD